MDVIFNRAKPDAAGEWRVIQTDVMDGLSRLRDNSVRLIITSPPFFQLRDYLVFGQIGLEKNPNGYLDRMGAVAKELHRVLTDDGSLWLNIGETWNGSGGPGGDFRRGDGSYRISTDVGADVPGVPKKAQLCIPDVLSLRFILEGWIRRGTIIWATGDARRGAEDRLSDDIEYIYQFVKGGRYRFDRNAVKQPAADPDDAPVLLRSVWSISPGNQPCVDVDGDLVRGIASFPPLIPEIIVNLASDPGDVVLDPFSGMGTTGVGALTWGRSYIGIELSPRFAEASRRRLRALPGGRGDKELHDRLPRQRLDDLPLWSATR